MNEYTSEIMTMEEMIDTLKGLVFNSFDRTSVKERQALDMAIFALSVFDNWSKCETKEKIPYDKNMRLINSRQIVYTWTKDLNGKVHDGITLESIINTMPTVDVSALSKMESAGTQITNSNLKSESEKLDGDLISRFCDYQIEWLTSHNDIDLQETEMRVVQFLKDTAECFVKTELPSAEKTAEWKKISPAGIYECTNCECWSDDKTRYCPTCGRRMKGVEE